MKPAPETSELCRPFPLPIRGHEGEFRTEWRTEAVVGLVRGIVQDKAFERMPILADALEEAGCDSLPVLRHCRDPIAHEDHCWVLGLISGTATRLPRPPVSVPRPSRSPYQPMGHHEGLFHRSVWPLLVGFVVFFALAVYIQRRL